MEPDISSDPTLPKFDKPLFLLLAVALLIRLITVFPSHTGGLISDEREYWYLAHQIVGGGGYVDSNFDLSIKPPLFPALLSVCALINTTSLVLPFVLVAGLSTVAVYLVYLLAFALWDDRRFALCAAAVMALFPSMVLYGSLLLSENLFLVLFLFSLLLTIRLQSDVRYSSHVGFGIVAASAVLTRAVFLGLVPLLLLVLFMKRRQAKNHPYRVGFAFLVFLVALLPWTVRNYTVHHAFVPVSSFGGRSLLMGNNPFTHGTTKFDAGYDDWLALEYQRHGVEDPFALMEVPRIKVEQRIAIDYMLAHPGQTVIHSLEKAYVFGIYPMNHRADSHPLQAFLMLADLLLWCGVIFGLILVKKSRALWAIVWLTIAYFTATHMILHAESRYRLPLIPLFCIIAGSVLYFFVTDREKVLGELRESKRFILGGSLMLVCLYGYACIRVFAGGF